MHRSLFRALATTATLAAALTVAPAAQAAAPTCPVGSSTPVDFSVAGSYRTLVSVNTISRTQTNVCVLVAGQVGFRLGVGNPSGSVLPTVTQTDDAGACALPVLSMTTPVALTVSAGVDAATRSFCFALNGNRTTITVGLPGSTPPDVTLWTYGDTLLDWYVYCAPYAAEYAIGLTDGSAWTSCRTQPHAIVP